MPVRTPRPVVCYTHPAPVAGTQAPDPRPGHYYVTVLDREANDGRGRVGYLLGPMGSHAAALACVGAASRLAEEHDCRACWYAFGTVRRRRSPGTGKLPDGVFNDLLEAEMKAALEAHPPPEGDPDAELPESGDTE